ncbi:MAG TPA: hypothetical protein VKT82_24665 [Ktedonobacterales bacterium]|nr:hypothetical protein [Ktedonobacterales bacterium]
MEAQEEAQAIPHVQAKAEKGWTNWQLAVRCPYCGQKHYHGGGPITSAPYGGHRVPDCFTPGNRGYYVDIPEQRRSARK